MPGQQDGTDDCTESGGEEEGGFGVVGADFSCGDLVAGVAEGGGDEEEGAGVEGAGEGGPGLDDDGCSGKAHGHTSPAAEADVFFQHED